ncbi:uncharacterized protein LOC133173314 [Saccostrea echinata]|uniref:uncharacterized protein LOC133173314 n=1 Tax=Saccostrea echinata TaxID=191078 RepID=UPI002A80F6A6|nr:uncharacterized protein LOC133173314 [Saccostrea echinata]
MPRSKEPLNFLLVSSLLHVASQVLIKTVKSVTARLNTSLEQLLNLHRHGFFHSWKTKECCKCDQPFRNSASILSTTEWNRLFQKTEEDCERAPQVECSCCFQASNIIDPDCFTINISTCILERSVALEENELKNIQQIRDANRKLVDKREEATLTEEEFTSLSSDLTKALHDMSKRHGDEYYNDIVENIQRIDNSEPNDEEAKRILERFDQDNQVPPISEEKKEILRQLEYQGDDSTRSDISVCGSDVEDLPDDVEIFGEQDPLLLAESQIPKNGDDISVDWGDSDADDEDEEKEYGTLLKRMKEKFDYLSEKCLTVGRELSDVRLRMGSSLTVPESKAQPEEVLRQELREIEMMRKFIDNDLDDDLDDDVRKIYLPYENFHVSKSPEVSLGPPFIKPTYYGKERVLSPPRPNFAAYAQSQINRKQFSNGLSSINNIFKRNLHVANNWTLDPIPRKYDQGIFLKSSTGDIKPKSVPVESSISRSGNENEDTLSTYQENDPVGKTRSPITASMFKIDYAKYEKCIKDSEKVLVDSPRTRKDVGSILCERQHGHYLRMCEQQSNDLMRKTENLKQDIQRLRSRFDSCEQLLSENLKLYQTMPICQDMVDGEVKTFPVTTSYNDTPRSPALRMKYQTSTPRLAGKPSTSGSRWNELALNLDVGSETSDDEESVLEKRHGDSLRKLHAECESLRQRCTRSKRDLQEAREQMTNSSSHLDLWENFPYESNYKDDLDGLDNELSNIKWKQDILDESYDSAYNTLASGRSTGYSIKSRPTSSRSPYTDITIPSINTLSTARKLGDEVSPAYTPRSMYSPGYQSDDEDPVQDYYTPNKITIPKRLEKKSPILKPTLQRTSDYSPVYYNKKEFEESKEDLVQDEELEMENQYGEFLDQCKSNFLTISAKSLELKQEIRRLRFDMGLSLNQRQEPKLSPVPERRFNRKYNLRIPRLDISLENRTNKVSTYNTTEKYPENWAYPDSCEENEDEPYITAFEKELSVAEESYGNFLSSMKSNFDTLNERSMRTKEELRALRKNMLTPTIHVYGRGTCGGEEYCQPYFSMPMELSSY